MLKSIEIIGFKSFGEKTKLDFGSPISAIVGPNGSGKSNVAEAFRFALGEQSIKSLRGRRSDDLIFNGSNGRARANRASVKITFDNSKRLLDLDFDEIVVERIVHRDGTHEYKINDSRVRRKDVAELLAKAGIGSTGHHIISQGEADRVLAVSADERRTMIEDALGLRIFHFKKRESMTKLDKTEQNLKEVKTLQREIRPHLIFLKKQIEKADKAREVEQQIISLYREYFSFEKGFIEVEKSKIQEERKAPEAEVREIETEIARLKVVLDNGKNESTFHADLMKLSDELAETQNIRNKLTRELGRLEGEIDAISRIIRTREKVENHTLIHIPYREASLFLRDIGARAEGLLQATNIGGLHSFVRDIPHLVGSFFARFKEAQSELAEESVTNPSMLMEKQSVIQSEITRLDDRKDTLLTKQQNIQQRHESEQKEFFVAERDLFKVLARKNDIGSILAKLHDRLLLITKREDTFKKDLGEAGIIFGREAVAYATFDGIFDEDLQNKRYRDIERMRIKLEEIGIGSVHEVEKEYRDVSERDQFLEREIDDLTRSRESLLSMIADIESELNTRFQNGIVRINEQFNEFFRTMFGGGEAELILVKPKTRKKREEDLLDFENMETAEEEENTKDGIDITVRLPRKKIHSLNMLSGGERALTSIALLFALSQINPPPFIILDETDAALDEANSRRYGDMIENLSKYSQLILITHNRETMSRAGLLYGVTMKGDGISRLLSIAFDEAVLVAK